jgi:hypothetical protein
MEIDTLVKNIQTLGFKTYVITKKGWTYSDISHLFEPKKIFIFPTTDVGYGDYGRSYPEEIKKEKWQDAYGIIQCLDYNGSDEIGVAFSVIPKTSFNNTKIIAACLSLEQECSVCKRRFAHVKIDIELGLVYCLECYSQIPSFSLLKFSL